MRSQTFQAIYAHKVDEEHVCTWPVLFFKHLSLTMDEFCHNVLWNQRPCILHGLERYKSNVMSRVLRIWLVFRSPRPLRIISHQTLNKGDFQYYRSVPFIGASIFRLRYVVVFGHVSGLRSYEMHVPYCQENAADTLMTLLVKDQSLLANSEVVTWPKTSPGDLLGGPRGTNGMIWSNSLDQCMAYIFAYM